MRYLASLLLPIAIMTSSTLLAQPRGPQPGLVEAIQALDEAIGLLGTGAKSPEKERALRKLAMVRARLAETIQASGVVMQGPGATTVVGPGGKVEVRPGPGGQPSVVVTMTGEPPPHPPPPPEPRMLGRGPEPMRAQDFGELLSGLKKLAHGSEKVALVKDATRHHRFSSDQVREVVVLLDFGTDKVEAAAAMYPRVIDKQNFFKVNSALDFESDREALRKRVEKWDKVGLPKQDDDD